MQKQDFKLDKIKSRYDCVLHTTNFQSRDTDKLEE